MTVHSLKYKMAESLKMNLLIIHDKTDIFGNTLKGYIIVVSLNQKVVLQCT